MRKMKLVQLEDRSTPAAVGHLDLTFGGTGAVTPGALLNIPDASVPTVVGRQSDGKLIIGSTAYFTAGDTDFAIYRLNTDGSLDQTFGTNGLTTVAFDLAGGTKADRLNALAVMPDNRIVAAGYSEGASGIRQVAVARLTAAGKLDTTFNTTGTKNFTFSLAGNDDEANSVALYSDGRIAIGATVKFNTTTDLDFGFARLTTTGAFDSTFNGNGKNVVGFDLVGSNFSETLGGIAIGPNNTLIGVGTVNKSGANTDAGVVRLLQDGKLDSAFNTSGKQTYAIDNAGTNGANSAVAVSVLSDGRIVLAGTVAVANAAGVNTDFYAGRIKAYSTPDTPFGANGFVAAGFNFTGTRLDKAGAVAVDSLGRVLIAGSVQIGTNDYDFGIARLTPTGTLDTSFNGTGGQQIPFDRGGSNADFGYGMLIQPDNRIVISGTATTASGAMASVARLFGSIGTPSALAVGGTPDGAASTFVVDTTNKYVAGPTGTIFPNYSGPVRTVVADFNGDGIADTAYGIGPGGGSQVRVIDGATGSDLANMSTYEASFTGGLFVAAGDIDGNGKAELVVSPDQGGGGRVQIFSVQNGTLAQRDNFFGIDDTNFRGGARVAVGDVNNDGRLDLIVGAGFGGGPRVAIFDGITLLQNAATPNRVIGDFYAFPGPDATTLRNGVFVASGDIDGDGYADLIFGGGPGGGPRVYGISGKLVTANNVVGAQAAPIVNFFVANDTTSRGGIRVAVKDIDNDGHADLVVGSGDGLPSRVRVYLGTSAASLVGSEGTGALWQSFDPYGKTLAAGVYVG